MSIVSCGVCDSSCLKGSMYVCGECATKAGGTQPTDNQHTQPAICAHLKVNRQCYVWGHRGKKVCACCEKARKQQAGA